MTGESIKFVDFHNVVQLISVLVCLQISCTTTKISTNLRLLPVTDHYYIHKSNQSSLQGMDWKRLRMLGTIHGRRRRRRNPSDAAAKSRSRPLHCTCRPVPRSVGPIPRQPSPRLPPSVRRARTDGQDRQECSGYVISPLGPKPP